MLARVQTSGFWILPLLGTARARTCPAKCQLNACASFIGSAQISSDCSSYLQSTVSLCPSTYTSYIYDTSTAAAETTTIPTYLDVTSTSYDVVATTLNTTFVSVTTVDLTSSYTATETVLSGISYYPAAEKRDVGQMCTATQISNSLPSYLSECNCGSTSAYSSACSALGLTATTVLDQPSTSTVTVIVNTVITALPVTENNTLTSTVEDVITTTSTEIDTYEAISTTTEIVSSAAATSALVFPSETAACTAFYLVSTEYNLTIVDIDNEGPLWVNPGPPAVASSLGNAQFEILASGTPSEVGQSYPVVVGQYGVETGEGIGLTCDLDDVDTFLCTIVGGPGFFYYNGQYTVTVPGHPTAYNLFYALDADASQSAGGVNITLTAVPAC